MPEAVSSISDQVAAILAAAEQTAAQLRAEAEERLKARIAEADRAAENRVSAAEEEAAEIVRAAHEEATRIARDTVARAQAEADRIRMEASEAKEKATSEALEIVARAQENAEATTREATEAALKTRSEADERAREMIREARDVSGDVRADGVELADHVRQLGDSLRRNAERLLNDVQAVHSTYLAKIDKVDPSRSKLRAVDAGVSGRAGDRRARARDVVAGSGDELDVPEFIPRAPGSA
jgi:vacuolar-type H+-ATPase subunit H